MTCTAVIPTTGRENLRELLAALRAGVQEVLVVDDRPAPADEIPVPGGGIPVRVLRSGGRGPAGARNVGWAAARTEWVVFLDDDVLPGAGWAEALQRDLDGAAADVGAVQARISVPLPQHRAPTDWERCTAALAEARWITADMAYRRAALVEAGGFDESFPRAYREDADLALRVTELGWRIARGQRCTTHPVRAEDPLVSLRMQRGNADNATMRRKHGRRWRERIGEGPGRIRRHALTIVSGMLGIAGILLRRKDIALAGAAGWLALTGEFAWRRIAPGPRTGREVAAMLVTSAAIPPAACYHRLRGELRPHRPVPGPPSAVLFDRDDTLIHDVPYNGDPTRVRPVRGAAEALESLRRNGIPLGVISNQSGVARGLLTAEQVRAVNEQVERALGPIAAWEVCPHGDGDGCGCRKPAPGMVHRAAAALGVPARDCLVIGDTGSDVDAALAAGAQAVLVPTERTREAEIRRARREAAVAETLEQAVRPASRGGA